jgi:chromosome segregation ATPase
MVKTGTFCLCFNFVFIAFVIPSVPSQIIYRNDNEIGGTFTENLKTTACSDSVTACGDRLSQCSIQNGVFRKSLRDLQKIQASHSKCGIRVQELEVNVSESVSTIGSLNKSLLQANVLLQDCMNKLSVESKERAALNKSVTFCNRALERSSLNLTNTVFALNAKNETLYRKIVELRQTSRDLNNERAKSAAINDSLGRCDKIRRETQVNLTIIQNILTEKEEKIVVLETENMQCNITLNKSLSNMSSASLALQTLKTDQAKCLADLQAENVTSAECARHRSLLNETLVNCENKLENSTNIFSDCLIKLSPLENEVSKLKSIQERQLMNLTNNARQLVELNDSLQICEANLSDWKQAMSRNALTVTVMKTNFSIAISECVNETKRLEEKIQNCETSLSISSKNFSELVNRVSRENISAEQSWRELRNRTNQLENELSEYKSKLDQIRFLPKSKLYLFNNVLKITFHYVCRL